MRITPIVGVEGLFEVKQPWTVLGDNVYECIANRAMSDLMDAGIDILEFVYKPVGLGEQEYSSDVKEGACIISLLNKSNPDAKVIHIPDTYIISYPNMDISNYNRMIVSVDLGALPINTDVTSMIVYLKQAALDMIGVESDPVVHKGPASNSITFEQHQELVKKRIANKKKNHSLDVINEDLKNENAELRKQLDIAIKNNQKLQEELNQKN